MESNNRQVLSQLIAHGIIFISGEKLRSLGFVDFEGNGVGNINEPSQCYFYQNHGIKPLENDYFAVVEKQPQQRN